MKKRPETMSTDTEEGYPSIPTHIVEIIRLARNRLRER